MLRTTDQAWATAYHEAGHVVVAHCFGKFVSERGVTIDGYRLDGLRAASKGTSPMGCLQGPTD